MGVDSMAIRVVLTGDAPRPVGPYSQALALDQLVFVAGQLGLNPETGKLVSNDIRAQTHQALQNVGAVLEASGSSLRYVLKTTVFVTDLANFAAVNEVYSEYFSEGRPARSTVGVAQLPAGAGVEIDAIAYVPPQESETG